MIQDQRNLLNTNYIDSDATFKFVPREGDSSVYDAKVLIYKKPVESIEERISGERPYEEFDFATIRFDSGISDESRRKILDIQGYAFMLQRDSIVRYCKSISSENFPEDDFVPPTPPRIRGIAELLFEAVNRERR